MARALSRFLAGSEAARWRIAARYLAISAVLHLGWEIAHLPFYSLWLAPLKERVFGVLHCTGGDILIAASTLGAGCPAGGPPLALDTCRQTARHPRRDHSRRGLHDIQRVAQCRSPPELGLCAIYAVAAAIRNRLDAGSAMAGVAVDRIESGDTARQTTSRADAAMILVTACSQSRLTCINVGPCKVGDCWIAMAMRLHRPGSPDHGSRGGKASLTRDVRRVRRLSRLASPSS